MLNISLYTLIIIVSGQQQFWQRPDSLICTVYTLLALAGNVIYRLKFDNYDVVTTLPLSAHSDMRFEPLVTHRHVAPQRKGWQYHSDAWSQFDVMLFTNCSGSRHPWGSLAYFLGLAKATIYLFSGYSTTPFIKYRPWVILGNGAHFFDVIRLRNRPWVSLG